VEEKAVILQDSSIQLIETKCLLLRLFQKLDFYKSFEICTVVIIIIIIITIIIIIIRAVVLTITISCPLLCENKPEGSLEILKKNTKIWRCESANHKMNITCTLDVVP
jgi:hypothetical protein